MKEKHDRQTNEKIEQLRSELSKDMIQTRNKLKKEYDEKLSNKESDVSELNNQI